MSSLVRLVRTRRCAGEPRASWPGAMCNVRVMGEWCVGWGVLCCCAVVCGVYVRSRRKIIRRFKGRGHISSNPVYLPFICMNTSSCERIPQHCSCTHRVSSTFKLPLPTDCMYRRIRVIAVFVSKQAIYGTCRHLLYAAQPQPTYRLLPFLRPSLFSRSSAPMGDDPLKKDHPP